MTTFLDAIAVRDGAWVVPDGWQQGRGAFGGLVLGALADAMVAAEADGARLLRTFSGDVVAPVLAQPSRLVTRPLRRGNNQTNQEASLEQDGAVVARATAVLAATRKAVPATIPGDAPPDLSPFDDARRLVLPVPPGPSFSRHYDFRPTVLPFTSGPEARVEGWVREAEVLPRLTAGALIGRLDAHWPAIFTTAAGPRPCATVSFLAEILCDPRDLDPRAPHAYRARAVAQAGGYFVELRELWHEGRVVALNQQVFALLG